MHRVDTVAVENAYRDWWHQWDRTEPLFFADTLGNIFRTANVNMNFTHDIRFAVGSSADPGRDLWAELDRE